MATLAELVEQAYPKQEVSPGTPLTLPEGSKRFPRPPVADFVKNWEPYVNPEAATPGIVGETVGKQGAFQQAVSSPIVPSPTSKPMPKETAPATLPEGIPTGDLDKEDKSTTPPTLESTVTDKTWTDYGEAGGKLAEIEVNKANLAKDVASLKDRMTNDVRSLEEYKKLMASQLRLEDALDPESAGFKTFAKNISDTAQKMQAARADLEDYQKKAKADPNRYWRETPALEHVFNGIAMLMEGNVAAAATRAGMSMPTGMVQQRIDKAIQDDLNRQREEFKSGEAARENTINRFRDNMKILGDERAAALKTEIEFMSQVKNRMDLIAKDPKYQSEADKLLAREASLKLEEQAALKEAEMNKIIMKTQTETKPLVGKALSPEDIRKENELNITVLGIPNRVRSVRDAEFMKERSAAAEQAVIAVRAMKQVRKQMDLGYVPVVGGLSKIKQLGDVLRYNLELQLKQNYNLGTLDKGSLDFMERMIPGTDQWGQASAKLDALEKGFTAGYTADLNQRIDGKRYKAQDVSDQFDVYDKELGLTEYWLSGLK